MEDTYRKLYFEDATWYFESDNIDKQPWSSHSFDKDIDAIYLRKCGRSSCLSYEISHETAVIDYEKF